MAASAMPYHPSTSTSAGSMHSWTSLGSMSSTAASTSSPRSTRSNSLTSGNAAGGMSTSATQMHATVAGQAGVPAPTDDELKGRTYLEWIRSWDDDQVAKWLTDNRCAAHAQTFASNDIRGNVLLDVDQQALKEMGVQSVSEPGCCIICVLTVSFLTSSLHALAYCRSEIASRLQLPSRSCDRRARPRQSHNSLLRGGHCITADPSPHCTRLHRIQFPLLPVPTSLLKLSSHRLNSLDA